MKQIENYIMRRIHSSVFSLLDSMEDKLILNKLEKIQDLAPFKSLVDPESIPSELVS